MKFLTYYRKLLKKYPTAHILITFTALIMLWWGIWGILDKIFLKDGYEEIGYIGSIVIGLLIIFIDDFKLKEIGEGHR